MDRDTVNAGRLDRQAQNHCGKTEPLFPITGDPTSSVTSGGRNHDDVFAPLAPNPIPPHRTKAQKFRVLALLKERGERGVLGSELYSRPLEFGRSPRNAISQLRHAGYVILGEARGSSDWFYRLVENPQRSQTASRGR